MREKRMECRKREREEPRRGRLLLGLDRDTRVLGLTWKRTCQHRERARKGWVPPLRLG